MDKESKNKLWFIANCEVSKNTIISNQCPYRLSTSSIYIQWHQRYSEAVNLFNDNICWVKKTCLDHTATERLFLRMQEIRGQANHFAQPVHDDCLQLRTRRTWRLQMAQVYLVNTDFVIVKTEAREEKITFKKFMKKHLRCFMVCR